MSKPAQHGLGLDQVELESGETIRADIYVAATGVKPNIEPLQGSGVATWSQAVNHCQNLVFDGHDDWRLPSLVELMSLLDYGLGGPNGDQYAFPAPFPSGGPDFWTSTRDQVEPLDAWRVLGQSGLAERTNPNFHEGALCVRGPKPHGAFSIGVGGSTVAHSMTGLVWQRQASPAVLSWVEALDYCESLALAGHDDWRLPSQKELWTLFDDTIGGALIDQVTFPGPLQLWSSSPRFDKWGEDSYPCPCAWAVDFQTGSLNFPGATGSPPMYVDYMLSARCVRGGQASSGNP